MLAKIEGEVRRVVVADDGDSADLFVLGDDATSSDRVWCGRKVEGWKGIEVGDRVELLVWADAKLSKAGNAYLSVMGRTVKKLAAAGGVIPAPAAVKSA